LRGLADQI
jgi:tRNA(His) guanylyltransferase